VWVSFFVSSLVGLGLWVCGLFLGSLVSMGGGFIFLLFFCLVSLGGRFVLGWGGVVGVRVGLVWLCFFLFVVGFVLGFFSFRWFFLLLLVVGCLGFYGCRGVGSCGSGFGFSGVWFRFVFFPGSLFCPFFLSLFGVWYGLSLWSFFSLFFMGGVSGGFSGGGCVFFSCSICGSFFCLFLLVVVVSGGVFTYFLRLVFFFGFSFFFGIWSFFSFFGSVGEV